MGKLILLSFVILSSAFFSCDNKKYMDEKAKKMDKPTPGVGADPNTGTGVDVDTTTSETRVVK